MNIRIIASFILVYLHVCGNDTVDLNVSSCLVHSWPLLSITKA